MPKRNPKPKPDPLAKVSAPNLRRMVKRLRTQVNQLEAMLASSRDIIQHGRGDRQCLAARVMELENRIADLRQDRDNHVRVAESLVERNDHLAAVRRFTAADVTQEDIAAVEDVQSHSHGAWDMVPPAEIIAAAWNRLSAALKRGTTLHTQVSEPLPDSAPATEWVKDLPHEENFWFAATLVRAGDRPRYTQTPSPADPSTPPSHPAPPVSLPLAACRQGAWGWSSWWRGPESPDHYLHATSSPSPWPGVTFTNDIDEYEHPYCVDTTIGRCLWSWPTETQVWKVPRVGPNRPLSLSLAHTGPVKIGGGE